MARRRATSAVAVLLLLGAVLVGLSQRTDGTAPVAAAISEAAPTGLAPPPQLATAGPAPAGPGDGSVDPKLISRLRSRYGAHIGKSYVQIQMLEELMRYFQKRDPEHWKEALLASVRASFPERHGEIARNLERRLEYERWAKDNQSRLLQLDPEERREELWEERNRLFGKDGAADIWSSELKNQDVADVLKEIDGQRGVSLGDKVETYKQRLEDIYQEEYDSYLSNHQHEVMNRFLSLESVQADLSAMKPEEREQNLRDIRKGMGLDEAALERWKALDQKRDAHWENGTKYMAEREALALRYTGSELEQKLRELREHAFGTEAEVIAAEEQSGFFRFGSPRRWGQN